jgi:hypothetical protein
MAGWLLFVNLILATSLLCFITQFHSNCSQSISYKDGLTQNATFLSDEIAEKGTLKPTEHDKYQNSVSSDWFENKVKYAYQQRSHTEDTASPHSQQVERKKEHG